ncbi:RadC family protein [Radicibacter daui]|uniref:RadC family protein n=1 Tax=Radicibacter daui TaxID=3064829 RepID=UPI004046D0DB
MAPAKRGAVAEKAEKNKGTEAEQPKHSGHRKRLRERYAGAGPDAFADYELLELILFSSFPRQDTKPLAKTLIKQFGNFAGVVSAGIPALMTAGLSLNAAVTLTSVRDAALRLARQEVLNRPVIASWQKLLDYVNAAMMHEKTEHFRLLFLDKKNALIADEVQQQGTVDSAPVYPREVVKRALELSATALILVHNHPSGDPTPSRADIEMTRAIADAARAVNIVVHDHLIVARASTASFKSLGLL